MTEIFRLAIMSISVSDNRDNFPALTKLNKSDIKLSKSTMRLAVTKIY